MKPKLALAVISCIVFLSCKKDKPADTNNNIHSPKAGSTWRYKITTKNGSVTDSFYMNWKARDTILNGEKWLAIDKQVGSSPFTPLFAMSPFNGSRSVLKLTSSGSNGLWLPANVSQGQTFSMHSPMGADYGFTNTTNGKTMQVLSTTHIFNENGVAYNSLTVAGIHETNSHGYLEESIYYQTYGAVMIWHKLDEYTQSTDSHYYIIWSLVNFTL
jgi:hypothetical protein